MANTVVTIKRDLGCRIPTPTEVPLAPGDTITFSAASGAATTIHFTAETAGILSPAPGASVTIAGGDSVSYTIGSPAARAYCVQTLPAGLPSQSIECESSSAAVLRVLPGCDPDFNGPDVPPPN